MPGNASASAAPFDRLRQRIASVPPRPAQLIHVLLHASETSADGTPKKWPTGAWWRNATMGESTSIANRTRASRSRRRSSGRFLTNLHGLGHTSPCSGRSPIAVVSRLTADGQCVTEPGVETIKVGRVAVEVPRTGVQCAFRGAARRGGVRAAGVVCPPLAPSQE